MSKSIFAIGIGLLCFIAFVFLLHGAERNICITNTRNHYAEYVSFREANRHARCYCDYDKYNTEYKCSELKPLTKTKQKEKKR